MKTRMEFDGVSREVEVAEFDKAWPQMAVDAYFIDDANRFEPLTEEQIDKLNDRTAMQGWD